MSYNHLACSQNFDPMFFLILGTLGFELVAMTFEGQPGSAIWQHPKIEESLEAELENGELDSSAFIENRQWHFFHVKNLGAAVNQLKASVESRGLLSITEIFHGESATEWRQYWPPTAELAVTES